MSFLNSIVSDEVSIVGLNRDASPVYKDDKNEPYFDVLSFDLTAFPSEKWIANFRDLAPVYINRKISETAHFDGTSLSLSVTKISVYLLQDFIYSLQNVFGNVNSNFEEDRINEAKQENEINDILDNLKF